ncbi:hypothetical protein [Bradyrhizobium sp.]|uniref:hypothetical protein n=1 Tax=Bradyrhizobium sp. TaxID=376 RepID=UPI00273341CB|nr:hypothetical protein [Bradyrhizobium sp.]MDP3078702.1 hypothetical protein [Bradyrhizobium sp.]
MRLFGYLIRLIEWAALTATHLTVAVVIGAAKSLFKGYSPSPKPQLPETVSAPPKPQQGAYEGNQVINVYMAPTQPGASMLPPSKIPPDDGRLYFTWQSEITPHPRSEDLLERVDHIAQVKFHDTAESIKPLKPDTSLPGGLRFDLPQVQEELTEFIPDSKPLMIPADDSQIYLADGSSFTLAGDMPMSLPKRIEPLIPMKLLFIPVPPDDGELWVARTSDILPLTNHPETA